MGNDELRRLIREILSEEIALLRGESGAFADTTPRPQIREEIVSVNSSSELMAFAEKILALANDGRAVSDLKAGRWVFKLAGSTTRATTSGPGPGPGPGHNCSARIDRGLVTERQTAALPSGSRLQLGKRVRLTPLAVDDIRRRHIHIERLEQ